MLDAPPDAHAGPRIRQLRTQRRMSLKDVSTRAGVSVSFLSQLERGVSDARLSTLRAIAAALGVMISDLFDSTLDAASRVLRRSERPALVDPSGPTRYLLTPPPLRSVEVTIGAFEPGQASTPEPYAHGDSQEILVVLEGSVTIEIDGSTHLLSVGDSIDFSSSQPHRVVNDSTASAEVMWIVSPPSPPDTPITTQEP